MRYTLFVICMFLIGCGQKGFNNDYQLDEIPRSLIQCLKGGSCPANITVKSGQSSNFANDFEDLWDNYPDYSTDQVKEDIGGNVNAEWLTNTCVVRLSHAFNYTRSLANISMQHSYLNTTRGEDGYRYAFRVREMILYMLETYGRPQVVNKQQAEGVAGIILFDRRGWSDADGHFDIWDGYTARYSDYMDESENIFIWK